MKKLRAFFIFQIVCLHILFAGTPTTYYVSTTGSSSNTGLTLNSPLATVAQAYTKMSAGDTIYVRGGTYTTTAQISLSVSGTDSTQRSCLFAYGNERPILDFSSMGTAHVSGSADGIRLTAKYWYIKGLDIVGAQHNGIALNGGSYNIVEFCAIYENRNAGLQIDNGGGFNRIINCDSYFNRDSTSSSSYDGNADGFSPKLQNGTMNYFYGCRAWQNSDDGWDGYVRPAAPVAGKDTMTTIIDNCWCFANGYLKSGAAGTGNGNGFKMGGGDKVNSVSNGDSLRHHMILTNCLSFYNKVKGFDQNNNRGTMTMINCTGYANGTYNFSVPGFIRVGETLTMKNCVSLASLGVNLVGVSDPILATDSWISPFAAADDSDFISVDTTGVRGPRKADGSLPDITFMHLKAGSQFVDAGTDVGLSYSGSAPDLGCFEYSAATGVTAADKSIPAQYKLSQNYPNPFNPSTVISYQLSANSRVTLKVYDVLGREVATLVDGVQPAGNRTAVWNASRFASGLYFYRLRTSSYQETKKMMLLK